MLQGIKKDLNSIFEQELDKDKVPKIHECAYVGMTGAGLNMSGEPI